MKAAPHSLTEVEEVRLGATLLMPSLLSFLGALLGWALAWAGVRSVAMLGIVMMLQALLMLSGAAVISGVHAAAAARWRRRVAPSAALQRVRMASRRMLRQLAARGVAGPLLMLVGLAWLQPGWDLLAMAAGVLLAVAATVLAGRALGEWLQRQVLPPAVARLQLPRTWRWPVGWWRWRRVPTWQQVDLRHPSGALWVACLLVPQALVQAAHWRFHAWGAAYTSGWDIAFAGLWMLVLGVFVHTAVIGPPLHWRARLAPGGLSAGRWARRMVAGSLLNAAVCVSVALAISMAVSKPDLRAVQLSAWAPVIGDVLLAMAWSLWLRGARNSSWRQGLGSLSLGLAAVLVAGLARVLGLALQRGPALLAAELALALVFAVAAQRAWARQDLNRLVPRA